MGKKMIAVVNKFCQSITDGYFCIIRNLDLCYLRKQDMQCWLWLILRRNMVTGLSDRWYSQNGKYTTTFLETILLELKKMGILGANLGKLVVIIWLNRQMKSVYLMWYVILKVQLHWCTVFWKGLSAMRILQDRETCKIRHVFKKIRDNTFDILQEATLASLI